MFAVLCLCSLLSVTASLEKLTDQTIHVQIDLFLSPDETHDTAKYGPIENWDTSLLQNTFCLFAASGIPCSDSNKVKGEHVRTFNADISKWNLSGVKASQRCEEHFDSDSCSVDSSKCIW